jgi:choline dehydrogenase-like flavoprotein
VRTALVVGSGAGGAAAAQALQGRFDVTILEAGRGFRPFRTDLGLPERLKRLGLLRDPRAIRALFPAMHVRRGADGTALVTGHATGGTTTVATASALRLDAGLRRLGIDLDAEFDELARLVPVTADHRAVWSVPSRRAFDACAAVGLEPSPLPKMGHQERCRGCGHCVLGCPHGVKWDARQLVAKARSRGARLLEGWRVRRIVGMGGAASGVVATSGVRRRFFAADAVIVAAGGLGTPAILQRSGIPCERRLFVDPVLCVATRWPGAAQDRELSMPFAVQREGLIIAPYFDYLSYFFDRRWRPRAGDIFSLMIKLADSGTGSVAGRRVGTNLTAADRARLGGAVDLCAEIFARLGVPRRELFLGTLNAGHPGGTLPLTAGDAASVHPTGLPDNVWVADASLFPESLGGPPILTIMALARRVASQVVAAAS